MNVVKYYFDDGDNMHCMSVAETVGIKATKCISLHFEVMYGQRSFVLIPL